VVKKKSKPDLKVENNSKLNNRLYIILAVIVIVVILAILITKFSGSRVENGDSVSVNYAGKLDDGTVFDTNIEEVAVAAGLTKDSYETFTFVTGDQSVIEGFDKNVLGMKKGAKKSFKVSVDEAYGPIKDELYTPGLNRTLVLLRYSNMDSKQFLTLFNQEPTLGLIVKNNMVPWSVKVADIMGTNIKIESLLNVGDPVKASGVTWDSRVIKVTNDSIFIRQDPKVGDSISIPTGQGVLRGIVTLVNEESFDVDANHPLAGKELNFEVEVVDIQKAKSD